MESQKLFELLLASQGAAPPYLGEFASAAALPPHLPPVYAWLSHAGDLHLDTDRAALARVCVAKAQSAGQPVAFGSTAVEQAVSRFCDIAATTWSATKSDNAKAISELKSARQRAAMRWSAAR